MYSTKEKLYHFRQLANPLAAEADLALLHEKNPQSTDFTRFDLAPCKNAEDILFALLDVADHDEIVRNRREYFSETETDDDGNPIDGNGNPTENDGNSIDGNENPTENDGNPIVDGKDGGEATNIDGKQVEPPVDTATDNGGSKKSKKSVSPKKKKKSTRK